MRLSKPQKPKLVLKPVAKPRLVLAAKPKRVALRPARITLRPKRKVVLLRRGSVQPHKYPKESLNGELLVDMENLDDNHYYWWTPYRKVGGGTEGFYPIMATGRYIKANWVAPDAEAPSVMQSVKRKKGSTASKPKRKRLSNYLPLKGTILPTESELLERSVRPNSFNVLLPNGLYETMTAYNPAWVSFWVGQDPKRRSYLLQE